MPQNFGVFNPQPQPSPTESPAFQAIRQIDADQNNHPNPDHIRQLMYALQAADALNTSSFLRNNPAGYENDPLFKGIAGKNPLPMMGAFGLEDLLMNLLTRKNPKLQKNAELTQAILNGAGILQTDASAKKYGRMP